MIDIEGLFADILSAYVIPGAICLAVFGGFLYLAISWQLDKAKPWTWKLVAWGGFVFVTTVCVGIMVWPE